MHSYLDKILNLAKKTGDRVIVVDQKNPRDCYVVMGIEEYENLIGNSDYTDDEIENTWENEMENISDISQENIKYNESSNIDHDFTEDIEDYSFNEELDNSLDNGTISNGLKHNFEPQNEQKNDNIKKRWEIADDVKRVGHEVSNKETDNTQVEEDRYYLETI